MRLAAYVGGIGVLGPGLDNWREAADVLSGRRAYLTAPTVLPIPTMLPAAERRRTGRVVKVALGVALEATSAAGADPAELAGVFASSGGDGQVCHEICQALALPGREVSPSRFANSVHNVAAGYWSIATGSMAETNILCAFDASFVAGLLDALAQSSVDGRAVLLVAYDTEYPQPLHAKRPIPDAFGVAMVLTPTREAHSLARIEATLSDAAFDTLPDPKLEALRAAVPAARSLPLLRLLALGTSGRTVLEYLDSARADVHIEPCH
jgi:hypothetical protein